MKYLVTLLLILAGVTSRAQVDGLYTFFLSDDTDTIYSLFNSNYQDRTLIGDYIVDMSREEPVKDGSYAITLSNGDVAYGEMYVSQARGTLMFDFYVDKITMKNGEVYEQKRFVKPKRSVKTE